MKQTNIGRGTVVTPKKRDTAFYLELAMTIAMASLGIVFAANEKWAAFVMVILFESRHRVSEGRYLTVQAGMMESLNKFADCLRDHAKVINQVVDRVTAKSAPIMPYIHKEDLN